MRAESAVELPNVKRITSDRYGNVVEIEFYEPKENLPAYQIEPLLGPPRPFRQVPKFNFNEAPYSE